MQVVTPADTDEEEDLMFQLRADRARGVGNMIYMLMVFLVGLFLSAFFSGSETGFYRATRVRVALDGLSGDLVSRVLLWLTNNPTLFVATALVGNNVANYLTSLAIVMASQRLFGNDPSVADLIAPVIMAPIVFIYGELLPKNLYFHAPNRLLRRGGLLFVVFGVLCAPIVALLWLMGRFAGAGDWPIARRCATSSGSQ